MIARTALAVVLLSLPTACIFVGSETDPPVYYESTGLLTLDWSIDGYQDPDECDQSDADTLLVSVWTLSGAHVGSFEDSCRAFVTSIELSPGTYEAEAVLLDPFGRDRTTAVLVEFDIYGEDELSISIDFPASSFY